MKKLLAAIIFSILLLIPSQAVSSQADFTISTADANTGATFRAAVNSALQALASMSSGDSAPPVTWAGMPWFDTLNGVVKIRDATNSSWKSWWDISLSITDLVPAGIVLPYSGATAPTGWLLCYGQAVSRTTYATLFAVISTTYGVGDGSTTFNLPDMRGRSAIGLDNLGGSAASRVAAATSRGQAAGAETANLAHTHTTSGHVLDLTEIPSHVHPAPVGMNFWVNSSGSYANLASGSGNALQSDTGGAGGGLSHEHGATTSGGSATQATMDPYIAMSYIIKY